MTGDPKRCSRRHGQAYGFLGQACAVAGDHLFVFCRLLSLDELALPPTPPPLPLLLLLLLPEWDGEE